VLSGHRDPSRVKCPCRREPKPARRAAIHGDTATAQRVIALAQAVAIAPGASDHADADPREDRFGPQSSRLATGMQALALDEEPASRVLAAPLAEFAEGVA
jgi:hypothetical protein